MAFASMPHPNPIPHVSGVIDRPRLVTRLQAVLDHKLSLLCAPPGYGKTTLVAQFALQLPYRVAWQGLEERDRDLPNLLTQALFALEAIAPGIQQIAPLPGYTPAELATLVADYLTANTVEPALYVLDDIQLLAGSPAVEVWLQTLVSALPANIHMVIMGRILPNLPLTEMIARGEVLALGQEQLRFTSDEVEDLAQHTGHASSETEAEALTSRLEGWPAGIVLALHPLPTELEQVMLRGGTGPEALFNALAISMLEAQPPALTDFLLASSTLERITPELCNAVLGHSNAAQWLAEAQKRNLFLSRVAGGMVYHRLFRDFLQSRLQTENPRLFVTLHTRAGHWFESHNQIEAGFQHYLAGGLVARAATLADQAAELYFAQGKVETLLTWRAQLGAMEQFAPRLLYNCARVATDRYHYDEAEFALAEAVKGFTASDHAVGLLDVEVQRAFIQLQRGEFHSAVHAAGQIAARGDALANQRGRALKILGVAYLRLGEIQAAVANLEQSQELHRAERDAHALANTLQDLSVAYSRQGRFQEASACLQEVVALRRELGSAGALAGALNNLGFYFHRSGHYRRAQTTFEDGLSIVARVPNRRVESALLWSLGDLKRDLGVFEDGLRLHNRALELIGHSDPWLRCAVLVSCATLLRWQGEAAQSAGLALKALRLAEEFEVALEGATAQVALWAAQAYLGHPETARAQIADALHTLDILNARPERVWALAVAAGLVLREENHHPSVARYLQAALREADEVGSMHTLAAEVRHTPALERYILDHAAQYEPLVQALNHLKAAQRESQPVEMPPEVIVIRETFSLRVTTLGRERLERDGDAVPDNSWRSTTARELFYVLLFNGPESREQISLAFWPDSSPKRVRSNFHTTLYRARQALGENAIAFVDGMYRISGDVEVWCDVSAFEDLVRQARVLPSRDARTEDLWQRAVGLYSGEFLPTWGADWALPIRMRLQEQYVEALSGLGHCARARGDFRSALDAYRRALSADAFREDIHRAIMQAYADLGEKKRVRDHLEFLRALLWDELALEPSRETTRLAATLLS